LKGLFVWIDHAGDQRGFAATDRPNLPAEMQECAREIDDATLNEV
jgi:hypothetical protein